MDDIWAYRVSRGGDTSVVTLSGEVDMNAEDELADVLLGEIRRPGTRTVQVDLEGVEFLDSSAINVLVRAYNEACETGRRLRVAGAHQTPLKVLEMTGPDAIGWHDVAELAGVPFRAVPAGEYVAYLTETFNLPETAARQLAALYADFRGPWASTPTATVAELIGRPALPGTEAVRRRVERFPAG